MVEQVLALEKLHGDVGQIVLLAGIEDRHNVLVLQPAGCLCLAEETLARIDQFVARELLAQGHGLDRHDTADLRVLAQIDHAHRALAEFLVDLVAPEHRLFDPAAVEQHRATRMGATSAEHDGLGQVLGTVELGLQVLVVLVVGSHVLVHGLGLVELALALEVQRQAVQVAHHGVTERNPAEAVERGIKLTLTLQRQAHHAIGFSRLLVGLQFAGLGDQETLGGQSQMPDDQQHRRQHQLEPGRIARQQAELGAKQADKCHQRDDCCHARRQARQHRDDVGRHQQEQGQRRPHTP